MALSAIVPPDQCVRFGSTRSKGVPLVAPIGPMLVPGVRTVGLVRYLEISGRVGDLVIFKQPNVCNMHRFTRYCLWIIQRTYDQDYTPVSIVIDKFINIQMQQYNRDF